MKGAIFTSFWDKHVHSSGVHFLPSPTFVTWYSFPAVNSGSLISSPTPIAPQRSRKEAWEITFIHAYACEHTSQGTNSSFHQSQFSSTVLLSLCLQAPGAWFLPGWGLAGLSSPPWIGPGYPVPVPIQTCFSWGCWFHLRIAMQCQGLWFWDFNFTR